VLRHPGKSARSYLVGAARGGDQSSSLTRHFLFGDVEPISAVVLGAIESGIRTRNQRIDCRDRVVGNSGADANGRADAVGADGSARNFKARADTFGDFADALQSAGNDRYKLFAAEPANDVVDTRARSHHLSENAQYTIANCMTKAVIDLKNQDRTSAPPPARLV
jgi:hypothetical protein